MKTYPKIESVFKRDVKTHYRTFTTEYSLPEFEQLKDAEWEWSEKIDGCNTRLYFSPDNPYIEIGGRTPEAQLRTDYFNYLQALLPHKPSMFPGATTLFGEGCGPKIQGGGKYGNSFRFILFDIWIDGINRWASRALVEEIGKAFNFPVVPILLSGTIYEALEVARKPFPSKVGDCMAEGLVGRPSLTIRDSHGHRVITKLKTKDFMIPENRRT